MKKIKGLVIVLFMLFLSTTNAQVSVNVNIGSPPLWGPVGYTEVQYYYLPDVEAYYDVHTSMFIYYGGGVWIRRAYLPTRYRYYDLYSGYKVVLTDYRGNEPYIHFKNHKVKYYKGYKGGNQKTIGEKPGKGNNKASSPSNNGGNKKSHQVNGNDGGQKKGNGGSYSNDKKSGGNSNGGSKGGGKNNQGGGHGGGGKKK
ncbi:MAG: hypothetical protein KA163_07910 [Bacteroidia bacterium]|nr:hypothetical protein [Bacteroidia bacterium]